MLGVEHYGINYILKFIKIEIYLLYFSSHKCRFGEQNHSFYIPFLPCPTYCTVLYTLYAAY